jgi:hypothetical protein
MLPFMLVCDGCGAEVQEAVCVPYRPNFDGYRNRPLAA